MNKFLSLITLCIVIGSCSYNKSFTGEYVAVKPSWRTKTYIPKDYRNTSYASMNTRLVLKSDSSFTLDLCGNLIKGFWSLNSGKDSLILSHCSNWYKGEEKYGYKTDSCTQKNIADLHRTFYLIRKKGRYLVQTNIGHVVGSDKELKTISLLKKH